jgi:hypothetical protein
LALDIENPVFRDARCPIDRDLEVAIAAAGIAIGCLINGKNCKKSSLV